MITTISLSPAVDKIYFVENFEAGKLYRVRNVKTSAGGKGINVARVAAILGEDVCTAGFKAGGAGEWLEARLKEMKVKTNFVQVEGESRTNNNIIDRAKGTETEILEKGPHITQQKADEFLALYKTLLPGTDVLVCSGGLPDGVPTDFYAKMIELARPYDIKIILDTSGETLKSGIKAKPYMIKPNLRELGEYAGRQLVDLDDVIAACRDILKEGISLVAASMGSRGVLLVSEDKVLYSRTPEIEVVNTIGSGDSMVAGLAAALSQGRGPEDMLRLGTACALANTQFDEIGFVTREMVEKFMEEIIIEEF